MESYNTCFEALTKEFDFYDEEAEQILNKMPMLADSYYWNKYKDNIMQSIDIALYFGNTQEQIVKNPHFIVMHPKDLLSKAALKILKDPDAAVVDTWNLSHKTFFAGTAATMNAILQGDLPAGYDIFTHTNETEKFLGLNLGEFVEKYKPETPTYDFIMQNLKNYRPETFDQLSADFPLYFENITQLFAENSINHEPSDEPAPEQSQQISEEKREETTTNLESVSPVVAEMNNVVPSQDNKASLSEQTQSVTSEAQTTMQSMDVYSQICAKYSISPKELKERLDFLKKEFSGIDMKQIQSYLLESPNLIKCSEQTIQKAKMFVQITFKAKPEQLKHFVKSSLNFPFFNLEEMKNSFELLGRYNLPITLANFHPRIYTIPSDELEKRIKLAQIINISANDFFNRMYKFPSDLVFARMQAFKSGELENPLIYATNSSFFEETGLTTEYLLEKYPFTETKQKDIDEQFEIIKNTYGVFWPKNECNYSRLRNGLTIYDRMGDTNERNSLKQKFAMLVKHGFTIEDINPYSSIFYHDANKLELRLKLARLNGISDKDFVTDKFSFSEHEIFARMMAEENGDILPGIAKYISASKLKNITGISMNDLMAKYPLTEEARTEINRKYAALVHGPQTTPPTQSKPKTFEEGKIPTFDFSEEDKALFKTVKSFDEKSAKIHAEDLTPEKTHFICNLFDVSETELAKMIKRNPLITAITPEIIKEKSSYLFENYNLSYDDFISGVQNCPYLAIKTSDEYDAFFKFCSQFLMLDLDHSRQLLINHPYSIGTSPELLLKKCKTIAQSLNVPFENATAAISEKPRVTLNALGTLESRVQTALGLGITKEQLLENLNFLASNPLDMKLKLMLNSIAGARVEDLLARNYLISPAKMYARIMFNLEFDLSLNVGTSEKHLAHDLNSLDNPQIPSELAQATSPTEIMMEMYPLDKNALKQIEIMYNLQRPRNKMKFTQEEIEHERS
ncbi:MAG: hypothetical protein IJW24_02585 [Clostridia bacterium]|nr:hypothetical protein [Clostridia bacterium]